LWCLSIDLDLLETIASLLLCSSGMGESNWNQGCFLVCLFVVLFIWNPTSYERACENKDLANGDCHLLESVKPRSFVALCVCVEGGGKVALSALKQSLCSLAAWAKSNAASVHCPHLGNWYSSEKVLQSAFRFGPVCYVYYYVRELPNFLAGVRLFLCTDDRDLFRHAVAFGAEIVDRPDEQVTVVGEHPMAGAAQVVSPLWLVKCFREGKQVSKEPFVVQ